MAVKTNLTNYSFISAVIIVIDNFVWNTLNILFAGMCDAENLLHYVTTMVCIAVKGIPTIGVIYRPFVREIGTLFSCSLQSFIAVLMYPVS